MTLLRPKVVLGVAGLIIFFILLSLAQEMNRRWQVQREVRQLEQQVRGMERSVVELENLNQYFRTDDYQERLAREKLDYRAPGEKVVLIPEEDVSSSEASAAEEQDSPSVSIPERWWHIFFVEENPVQTTL